MTLYRFWELRSSLKFDILKTLSYVRQSVVVLEFIFNFKVSGGYFHFCGDLMDEFFSNLDGAGVAAEIGKVSQKSEASQ